MQPEQQRAVGVGDGRITRGESLAKILEIHEDLVPDTVLSIRLVRSEPSGVEAGAFKKLTRGNPAQLEVRDEVLVLAGVIQQYASGLEQLDKLSDLGTTEQGFTSLLSGSRSYPRRALSAGQIPLPSLYSHRLLCFPSAPTHWRVYWCAASPLPLVGE